MGILKKIVKSGKKELTKSGRSGILSKLSDRAAARQAALKKVAAGRKKGLTNPGKCGKITKLSKRPE